MTIRRPHTFYPLHFVFDMVLRMTFIFYVFKILMVFAILEDDWDISASLRSGVIPSPLPPPPSMMCGPVLDTWTPDGPVWGPGIEEMLIIHLFHRAIFLFNPVVCKL